MGLAGSYTVWLGLLNPRLDFCNHNIGSVGLIICQGHWLQLLRHSTVYSTCRCIYQLFSSNASDKRVREKNIHSWYENMGDLYFSINHLYFYTSGWKQKSTFMTGYLIGVLVPYYLPGKPYTL